MGNGTTTLPLEDFTQRDFVAGFIRLKLNVITNKKSLFEPPFWGLMGDMRTPCKLIARWKARGQLSIRRSRTFFAISYG